MTPQAKLAKHIRSRFKHQDIKAKCSLHDACGMSWLRVSVPTYESRFSSDEIKAMCICAKVNGLTLSQGLEIDPDHQSLLTEKIQWDFVIPSPVVEKWSSMA